MAFAPWLPKVREQSEHFNERTWMCYPQAAPLERVVAHVGDVGQAKPHLEHNPLSLLGTCHATPIRKLNDLVFRVVCSRSRRYNAFSTGLASAGDVTCPRIATRERRQDHAIRRE